MCGLYLEELFHFYTASTKQRLNHFDTAYFSLYKEYFLKPCPQDRSTAAMIIKIRGFINNLFYLSNNLLQRWRVWNNPNRKRSEKTVGGEMCLAASRFSSEVEKSSAWSGSPHKLSDSALDHTGTLFQSSAEEDRTRTEVRPVMEVSFWNSDAIYAESEAEKSHEALF